MGVLADAQPAAITAHKEKTCRFCSPDLGRDEEIVLQDDRFIAFYDKYPVNPGHVLVIPRRHVESIFEFSPEEAAALLDFLKKVRGVLDEAHPKPDGYNIGINDGSAAGQTIFHLHIHVIPRYEGDVENPRGGIRNLKAALVEY